MVLSLVSVSVMRKKNSVNNKYMGNRFRDWRAISSICRCFVCFIALFHIKLIVFKVVIPYGNYIITMEPYPWLWLVQFNNTRYNII